MYRKSYKAKVEVTLNGSGFELPIGGSIQKTLEIPTASLSFPNPYGKFYQRFYQKDVFRIYVGKDDLPEQPTFIGYPIESGGTDVTTIRLVSRLNDLQNLYIYNTDISDAYYFPGWEVGRAIERLLFLAGLNPKETLQGTNPLTFIPQDYRKPDGISYYEFLKYARSLAFYVHPTTAEVLTYHLQEVGDDNDFVFLRQQPLLPQFSWWTFGYGDNLLASKPVVNDLTVVNRQTVFAADGTKVTFNLANEQKPYFSGIKEGVPIKLDYGNQEDAYSRARYECLKYRSPLVSTEIRHLDLIEAVPGISIVNITNAPYVVNGLHRVTSVSIDFSGSLSVTSTLEKRVLPLSKAISALLTSDYTAGQQ